MSVFNLFPVPFWSSSNRHPQLWKITRFVISPSLAIIVGARICPLPWKISFALQNQRHWIASWTSSLHSFAACRDLSMRTFPQVR